MGYGSQIYNFLDEEQINILSCFLVSYFEDLISDTNIWNTFVKKHKQLYSKVLPFYEIDEYYENEINYYDICFLIWYFTTNMGPEELINPESDFILAIAKDVLDIFDDEWESAPENEHLKQFYTIDENDSDYYKSRSIIENILFNSYLFFPDTQKELYYSEEELGKMQYSSNKNYTSVITQNRDNMLFTSRTRLLGLKGQEWVAEILGANHKLSSQFLELSPKISGLFLYKGEDDKNVFLEHIASKKKFNLTKKSFDKNFIIKEIDTIIFIGIVKWLDEWWFSGIYFLQDFDENIIEEEQNSSESKAKVNFLDFKERESQLKEILELQTEVFKQTNNNQIIAFLETSDAEEFIKKQLEFYNQAKEKGVKKEELSKLKFNKKSKVKTDITIGIDFNKRGSKSCLIFFNVEEGIEIAFDTNSAFPTKENPFFNEAESELHILRMFYDESISAELFRYCVDNYKEKLNYFNSLEGKIIVDDLDFLLRFFKKDNYYSSLKYSYTTT